MWKQRFYAFLLRRILGPYLTPSSKEKLHKSLDVSLIEGKIVLADVDLDADYMTSTLLLDSVGDGMSIRKFRLRKFKINLSLQEGNGLQDGGNASNVVRKMYKLGNNTDSNGAGVSLICHLEIDGIEIDIAPSDSSRTFKKERKRSDANETSSAGVTNLENEKRKENEETPVGNDSSSMVSSYIDAALKSLKLSVNVSDLCVKVFGQRIVHDNADTKGQILLSTKPWTTLHFDSASYRDLIDLSKPIPSSIRAAISLPEVILYKELELSGLSINVGEEYTFKPLDCKGNEVEITNSIDKLGKLEGVGIIRLRVTSLNNEVAHMPPRIQHDFEIQLKKKFSCFVSATSLTRMTKVVNDVVYSLKGEQLDNRSQNHLDVDINDQVNLLKDDFMNGNYFAAGEDENDAGLLANILKQQNEAHELARTQELRGGILVPSFTHDDIKGATITYDTFFDANDQSFSHYQNVLTESITYSENSNNSGFVNTKVSVHVSEASIKLSFNEDEDLVLESSTFACQATNFVQLNVGDFNLVSLINDNIKDTTLTVSRFQINDTSIFAWVGMDDLQKRTQTGTPLHFDKDNGNFTLSDSNCIVSPGQCISIHVKKDTTADDQTEMVVNLKIQSLTLICSQSTVSTISNLVDTINFITESTKSSETGKSQQSDEALLDGSKSSLKVSLVCDSVTIFVPCEVAWITSVGINHNDFKKLFERSNHICQKWSPPREPSFELVFESVNFSVFEGTNLTEKNRNLTGRSIESQIIFSCKRSLLSMNCPLSFFSDDPRITIEQLGLVKRFDIIGLESETMIDPDSLIRVKFSRTCLKDEPEALLRKKAKIYFPTAPLLSAVKASQQYESNGIDDACTSFEKQGRPKNNLRGSDPQSTMLADASRSENNVSVHVPSIAIDLESQEKDLLIELVLNLSQVLKGNAFTEKTSPKSISSSENLKRSEQKLGFAFRCDQVLMSLHQMNDKVGQTKNEHEKFYSFTFVLDGLRTHMLLDSFGLKNMRILFQDMTLYEVNKNADEIEEVEENSTALSGTTISQRCNLVRRRSAKKTHMESSPIFFRSKLSHPLSPKTPSFLLDLMMNRDEDDVVVERALYISVYDMTYRYKIDSCWIDQLGKILKFSDSMTDRESHNEEVISDSKKVQDDNDSVVTNLFVTVSDTNFDYTSPHYFKRPSRLHIRVSEIRVSSNIVTPIVATQTCKLSVADVSIHLSNVRSKHNVENSRLSCARLVLDPRDICTKGMNGFSNVTMSQSLEDALRRMNFISIATLDCFDAAIAASNPACREINHNVARSKAKIQVPQITVNLSIGRASVYTCCDSFACLSETFGELILKLTLPSQNDIEILRAQSTSLRRKRTTRKYLDDNDKAPNSPNNAINTVQNVEINNEEKSSNNVVPSTDKTSLFGIMNRDIFSKSGTIIDDVPNVFLEDSHIGKDKTKEFENVPDSELSASQLRKKYGMSTSGITDKDSHMIKDFYSVHTDGNARMKKHQSPNNLKSVTAKHESKGWTKVDHQWSHDTSIPEGEYQSSKWYDVKNESFAKSIHPSIFTEKGTVMVQGSKEKRCPQIFPLHIPINPVSDPLSGGDMNASKFAGHGIVPKVKFRILVKDMSLNCRFFDGYDWSISSNVSSPSCYESKKVKLGKDHRTTFRNTCKGRELIKDAMHSTKKKLMRDLLDENTRTNPGIFSNISEHGHWKRKCRQTDRFFQLYFTGLKLRMDSFAEAPEHRLASCMDLVIPELFLSETVSGSRPLKILGEWANEKVHPRDSNDGQVMMKMVSMHPKDRVSVDGKLMSDESHVTMELLPIRCFIKQSGLRFIRDFFYGDDENTSDKDSNEDEDRLAKTFFPVFKVKPCKLKINYTPIKLDIEALREGSYVELINLLPIEDMIIKLQEVKMYNLTGWGSVFSELLGKWLQDVSATQMHKFISGTTPIQPFAKVGDGMKDFVLIPLEEFQNDGNVKRGLRRGTSRLATSVAIEALNVTSKVSKYAAKGLNISMKKLSLHESSRSTRETSNPIRESFSQGLREANTKIIIVPYREYQRTGARSAMKSVIKGIPVAVCAPLGGATEALAYAAIDLRNRIRPDFKEEEEAAQKGLDPDF